MEGTTREGAEELLAAPEPALRLLFDTTALPLRYDPRQRLAVCQIAIDEGNVPAINYAVGHHRRRYARGLGPAITRHG